MNPIRHQNPATKKLEIIQVKSGRLNANFSLTFLSFFPATRSRKLFVAFITEAKKWRGEKWKLERSSTIDKMIEGVDSSENIWIQRFAHTHSLPCLLSDNVERFSSYTRLISSPFLFDVSSFKVTRILINRVWYFKEFLRRHFVTCKVKVTKKIGNKVFFFFRDFCRCWILNDEFS